LTGSDNIFVGESSGKNTTSGNNNNFLGFYAGKCNTTGCNNNFFGENAGCNNTIGCYNNLLGSQAGRLNTTGCYNNIIGAQAGRFNDSGSYNNFFGRYAGRSNTSGSHNIFLGWCAGNTNTLGSCNIAIGYDVELSIPTGSNQLAIGVGATSWIAGDSSFNVTVSTASTFSSSGVVVSGIVTATDFNSTSDAKLKTNVQIIPDPLEKVLQINGVSFNWIKDNKPSMGVIADNIQEVLPELVTDSDPKTVNYNGLIGLLIEVVKEQQTQINSLNERLSKLE